MQNSSSRIIPSLRRMLPRRIRPLRNKPPSKKPKKEESKPAAEAPKKEKKVPFSTLPPAKLSMDQFKRHYWNDDTKVIMKYFDDNFVEGEWSIWKVEYKYQSELKK